MDHDSIGGADEFIEAGKVIGIPVTVGFEMRCSMAGTAYQQSRPEFGCLPFYARNTAQDARRSGAFFGALSRKAQCQKLENGREVE
jgi:hypothetical protein